MTTPTPIPNPQGNSESVEPVGPMDFTAYVESHALTIDRTPFDVVTGFIREDGNVTPEVVAWLGNHEVNPWDIGRFLRLMGIANDVVVVARKSLDPNAVMDLLRGFASERPPTPMPEESPHWGERTRAVIWAVPETRVNAKQAWDQVAPPEEAPQIFRFAGSLAWVVAGRGESPKPVALQKERLKHIHSRTIEWLVMTMKGHKEVVPPDRVVQDMLASPQPPVPVLLAVRAVPVFGPSGTLATHPGYDASSRYFLWPEGITLPFVPKNPSERDIAKARHLIETELLGDFPFDDDGASKAHTIAAFLHPLVRPMINGPTPLHLIDKPTPGTGGTLLAEVITFPALGSSPPMMPVGKLEDEWRFRLLAMLRDSPAVIVLDNINEPLKSAAFASALTATTFGDRVVRSSTMLAVPVRNLWLASGNNVQMSHEITRRTVPIYLNANMEHPEEGREFRHPELLEWCADHRSDLLWAGVVLVQAWIAQGRPLWRERSLGSYEKWAQVMGGILSVAGIPGLLSNLDRLRRESDAEGRAWIEFVEAWFEQFSTRPAGSKELLTLAGDDLVAVLDLDPDGGRSLSTKWGVALRSKAGSIVDGYKIVSAGSKQGAALWRLEAVSGRHAGGEGEDGNGEDQTT